MASLSAADTICLMACLCVYEFLRDEQKRVVQRCFSLNMSDTVSIHYRNIHLFSLESSQQLYMYMESSQQLTAALNCGVFFLNNIASISKPQRDLSVSLFQEENFHVQFLLIYLALFLALSLSFTFSALFLSQLSCVILHSHVSAHCLSHFLRCGLSLSCALLCVLSLSVLLLTLVHSCSCSCSLFFPCLHDFSYAHPLPHVCS